MKIIKYELMREANCGTEEKPNIVQTVIPVSIRCKAEHLEFNEEIAKREAYKGIYTIEDDGVEETNEPTDAERIAELEEALAMLLNGVTE
jgi:hypothetical protein